MKRIILVGFTLAAVAGIFYLATLGCCQLIDLNTRPRSLADRLGLSPSQRQEVAALEGDFLAKKQESCLTLCAKRAQLIELFKRQDTDRATLASVVEEIGQEQTRLEKATLDHLVALNQHLSPDQRSRLIALTSQQLRTACKATACGATPGCALTGNDQR